MGSSTRFLVAEPIQSQARRTFAIPHHQRPNGGEVVELGMQVYWTVPDLTQQKFEDRWRSGTWLGKTER